MNEWAAGWRESPGNDLTGKAGVVTVPLKRKGTTMIDHYATFHFTAQLGAPSSALVDLSARPTAPVSAVGVRRPSPAPARLPAGLRRGAPPVEPRPAAARNRGTAAPLCQ